MQTFSREIWIRFFKICMSFSLAIPHTAAHLEVMQSHGEPCFSKWTPDTLQWLERKINFNADMILIPRLLLPWVEREMALTQPEMIYWRVLNQNIMVTSKVTLHSSWSHERLGLSTVWRIFQKIHLLGIWVLINFLGQSCVWENTVFKIFKGSWI